jgi:RHS repeat-associated protein
MTKKVAACLAVTVAMTLSGTVMAQTSVTRTSSFAYDVASGLPIQEVVEPDTPGVRLQTDYSYDGFGNKVSMTVSGTDIVTRTDGSSYDAKGQFVSSNTNALGQSESFQYDPRFGQPTSHTGPNGLTTTRSYDGFGRKIMEILPDGTQTKWAYLFCSGVNGGTATCPAGAAYLIETTPYAADGATANGPVLLVYYDLLNREVARDTQGFDGSTIRATTTYDALGRVSQTSRPYFLNGGTPQLTAYVYDALGRVVTRTLPDGGVSRTAYHGLTVTKTNALNQTRTVTKNSQGQVVSVTDALGKTMTYAYDPFGNLVQTTDAVGNVVTASYDRRGGKIASADPDLGNWSYNYNTLGLLVSQTNAKNQTTTLAYDRLDRLVQQIEPDMTSVWVYDTAAHGIGKLASTGITAGPGAGYAFSTSYDTLGRAVQAATAIDGATYTMGATYDANGRLAKVSYPSGFTARYAYTALGDASQLLDDATGQAYWTANATDAEQHLLQQTVGNGLITTNSFDAATGRLTGIATGSGATVQNLSFTYDRRGNPVSRSDANTNLGETFTYDALNRLTSTTVNLTPAPLAKAFVYDAVGNMLLKSDVGNYSYAPPGSPLPHAVTSVSGGAISSTFTYDANGNQTSGLGRTISYTSYNKPSSITHGARTISFLDDTAHQRFKQVTPEQTTLYISAFGVLAELSNPGASSQKWTDYLSAGGTQVGIRVLQSASETLTTRYFHTDHLGSIAAITDENGLVVERLSYDAWGKRRFPNGADDPTGSIASQSTRGFTGEEELSVSGLVHLNGRIYDPILARMTSADPNVSNPTNAQGWNRYSYVGNRPLKFDDPTGYFGEGPDVGGCNCANSGGMVFATPLPSPTVFSDPQIPCFCQSFAPAPMTYTFPTPNDFTYLGLLPTAPQNAATQAAQAAVTSYWLSAIFAGGGALPRAAPAPVIQVAGPAPAPPISGLPPGYQPTPSPLAPNPPMSLERILDKCGAFCDPAVQASVGPIGIPGELVFGALGTYARVARTLSEAERAPAVFDGEYATRQLLGTTTTPGGRNIMSHAADRMVNPPKGRVPMSPAEVDDVLDGATSVVKRSYHPEGDTLTIENSNMPGRPRVIVDEATGQRVITVINPRNR